MDQEPGKTRTDKFLWAIRLFKTRALAAEACEKGRVRVADTTVKASRNIKPGEVIVIHRGPWHQHVKVLALSERRMGAALVSGYYEDVTPAEELERFRLHQAALAAFQLKRGTGRPTKRDRRQMDDFMGDW